MVKNNQLVFCNASAKSEGLWTRTDRKKKSVIDYVIIEKENEGALKKLLIDEQREFAPYGVERDETNGTEKKCYSDHNVMITDLNWVILEQSKEEEKTIVTNNGYKQMQEDLKEIKVAEIFDKKKDIQICYDEWKSCIDKVIINNTTIIKNKNPRRVIRQLVKQKKNPQEENETGQQVPKKNPRNRSKDHRGKIESRKQQTI